MTPNPSPMHTGKPGLSTLLVKSGVQNRWELQFRTGGSGAVERKMDLSYYGSSEGILGLGSWVGQNNLTRKTERLDCWDLLT